MVMGLPYGSTDTAEKSFDLILDSLFANEVYFGDGNGKLNLKEVTEELSMTPFYYRKKHIEHAFRWLG